MRGSRWLSIGVVAVLAAAGCTKLLGISGDYTLGEQDGALPATDSGPEAGLGGSGGTEAGQAGSGGSAGTLQDAAEDVGDAAQEKDAGAGEADVADAVSPEDVTDSNPCKGGQTPCGDAGCVNVMGNDPSNCGACGHSCCGANCVTGVCDSWKKRASFQRNPRGIAVDDQFVYWANYALGDAGVVAEGGSIMKAPKDLSGVPEPVATGQSGPDAITVNADAGYVYWTNTGSSPNSGEIMRASVQGSGVTPLASGQANPTRLALDKTGTYLYWINVATGPTGTVRRVLAKDISAPVVEDVATGQANPRGVAVVEDNSGEAFVYWTNNDDGSVWRKPATQTLTEPLEQFVAPKPFNCVAFRIVGNSNAVFWTTWWGRAVLTASLPDGGAEFFAGGGGGSLDYTQKGVFGIALDSEAVYWTSRDGATTYSGVWRAPLDRSGPADRIWNDTAAPYDIIADEQCVYWTSPDDTPVLQYAAGWVNIGARHPNLAN
jgi:hypothetical protein